MKLKLLRQVVSVSLILFLAACNLPQGVVTEPDFGTISTRVALTLEALTASAPLEITVTPESQTTGAQISTQTSTVTPSPTFTLNPTQQSTNTPWATNTPLSDPGTIAGSISGYPYGSVPGLAIVAYGQEPPYNYSYVITGAGETYFSMSTPYLTPGHFQVVAYDASGHTGGCTFNVLVISNQTVICDITNWGGGYRSKPSGVPNP